MFNRAILIGRLTADPELKQTNSGTYVLNFTLAADRRFRGQDGERKADFIPIVCWRQQAEFVSKYFHKGDAIGIEGNIQTRNYEDKQGNKRTAIEVVADNVFFVGGRSGNNGGAYVPGIPAQAAAPAPVPAAPVAYSSGAASDFEEVEIDNDLPF